MIRSERRRVSMIRLVGCPSASSLPMPTGIGVGRVEDRPLEKLLRHELVVEFNLGTDLNVLSAPKEFGRSPNARHASMNCLSPR